MIPQIQKKKILMLVKTYPNPSKSYRETVCTAGITDTGEWIRLYPLVYRNLKDNQQFKKYSWVEANVYRNNKDTRPESYKVDESTLKVLEVLNAKKDAEERKKIINPLCKVSLEEIKELYKEQYVSLGIFKPKDVLDLEIVPDYKSWTDEEQAKLGQLGLFDNKKLKPLEKVPWKFSYKFTCNDERCKTVHKLKITDWELYQTYRNFKNYYPTEEIALQKLKEKWLNYYFYNEDRESYFIVGTVYPHPTFIILGVVSYAKIKKENKKKGSIIEGQMTLI